MARLESLFKTESQHWRKKTSWDGNLEDLDVTLEYLLLKCKHIACCHVAKRYRYLSLSEYLSYSCIYWGEEINNRKVCFEVKRNFGFENKIKCHCVPHTAKLHHHVMVSVITGSPVLLLLWTWSVLDMPVPWEPSKTALGPGCLPHSTQKLDGDLSSELWGDLGEGPETEVNSLMKHH